jgi:RimJ/RimL family protein N-acetyltransferase
VKLIPISEHQDAARILYQLLEERPAYANISHKAMPTWDEHLTFIGQKPGSWGSGRAHPYQVWHLVEEWCCLENSCEHIIVGSVYLSHANEIGVSIFRKYQGGGLGSRAVKLLMKEHGDRRYLANVAPANDPSRKMFEKLGFKTIQHTFALEAE